MEGAPANGVKAAEHQVEINMHNRTIKRVRIRVTCHLRILGLYKKLRTGHIVPGHAAVITGVYQT